MGPSSVQIRFSVGEAGQRAAWTEGLRRLGRAELELPLDWAPSPELDAGAAHLLRTVAASLTASSAEQGEIVTYGWCTLRLMDTARQGAPSESTLTLQQMADPFGDLERGFRDGASFAIRLYQAQADVLLRNGITEAPDPPHCTGWAIACNRLHGSAPARRAIMLQRLSIDDAADSGWCVACLDDDHEHDAKSGLVAHLHHLAADFPVILAYLALPLGYEVEIYGDRVELFPPGAARGTPDFAGPTNWAFTEFAT